MSTLGRKLNFRGFGNFSSHRIAFVAASHESLRNSRWRRIYTQQRRNRAENERVDAGEITQ